MVLVNETDVNRDMDDYLEQLQQISSNQLSLVSTLRAVSAVVVNVVWYPRWV